MSKLQWMLLLVMAASQCMHQIAAVKRTMPMIGMDEEGEEADTEDDAPATQQPRNALQALINGFLGQVLSLTMFHVMKRTCHAQFAVSTLHMPPQHSLGRGDQAYNRTLLARSGGCRRALMVLTAIIHGNYTLFAEPVNPVCAHYAHSA